MIIDTSTWDYEYDNEWRVAPAGLDWIKKGNHLRVGSDVSIEKGVMIGNHVTILSGAELRQDAIIRNRSFIEENVTIGRSVDMGEFSVIRRNTIIGTRAIIDTSVKIGEKCLIDPDVVIGSCSTLGHGVYVSQFSIIGNYASIGDNAIYVTDLGVTDGYRKVLCNVKGIAYIGAGCRWYTLPEAEAHWLLRPDRAATQLMIKYAYRLAKHHNLKTECN